MSFDHFCKRKKKEDINAHCSPFTIHSSIRMIIIVVLRFGAGAFLSLSIINIEHIPYKIYNPNGNQNPKGNTKEKTISLKNEK